ncbi:MAG: MYXO-CTERM sorting domain-containing protein [Polyangiaceae bacterium]
MRGKHWVTFLVTLLALSGVAGTAWGQVTVPYSENFDAEPTCSTTCGNACVLTGLWTNDTTDDFDWIVDVNGTVSGGTGPSGDHTTGSGNYLYTETSDTACNGVNVANLLSPTINLAGATAPVFTFWYHMLGATMGNLHVDVNDGTQWITDIVPPITDNVNLWQQTPPISLSPWVGMTVQIRLRSEGATSFTGDMAIDDFDLFEASIDIAVQSVDGLVESACGAPETTPVSATIAAEGGLPVSNISISYAVDGGVPVVETIPGPVTAPIQHTFATLANIAGGGVHTITVTATVAGDTNPNNDSRDGFVGNFVTFNTYPFVDDMEGMLQWVHGGPNDQWELGFGATPNVQGAASGTNAWITNLDGNYLNSSDGVISPTYCFDLSGLTNPAVSLAVNYATEFSWDGAVLQASPDNGITWNVVGALNDPLNWYNDGTLGGTPGGQQLGWTGRGATGSNGWVHAAHDLSAFAGQTVLLRVAFGSDGSVDGEGFGFDDFAVFEQADADVVVTNRVAAGSQVGGTIAGTTDVLTQTLDFSSVAAQTVSSVVLTKLGTIMDADLTARVWLDDGDGSFDSLLDTLLDTQTFAGGTATMATGLAIAAYGQQRVFVTVDVAMAAMAGDTFGTSVAMPSDVTAGSATVTFFSGPLESSLGFVAGLGTIPFVDDFSTPALNLTASFAAGSYPTATMIGTTVGSVTSSNDSLIELFASNPSLNNLFPVAGTQFATISFPNGLAVGALDYHFDMTGYMAANDIIWLGYRFTDAGEELHDGDNIFISLDGGATWAASIRRWDWTNPQEVWVEEVVDVSAALTAASLDYTSDVVIRFQAQDDTGLASDGLVIDEVVFGGAPEAQVERPAMTPIADGGTDAAGQVAATSQSFMYTITNLGAFPLPVDETSFATQNDMNVTNLTVTAPLGNVVDPGGTLQFQVDFDAGLGAFSFDVSFLTTDPHIQDSTYNFTVTGEGVEVMPEIDIQRPAGTSIASGMADPQGTVDVGVAQTLTYTIANLGFGADLNIGTAEIQNASNATANITTAPATVLAPNDTTTVEISYTADAEGAFSFDLVVTSDDADEGTYTIPVTGDAMSMGTGGMGAGGMGSGAGPGVGGMGASGTGGGDGGGGGGGAEGDGGCGCSTPGGGDSQMGGLFVLWIAGLAVAQRRRNRRRAA